MSKHQYPRTVEALASWDQARKEGDALRGTTSFEEGWNQINKEDRLAEAVGEAYGHDTSDFNNFENCKALVRPCPWLRQLVAV